MRSSKNRVRPKHKMNFMQSKLDLWLQARFLLQNMFGNQNTIQKEKHQSESLQSIMSTEAVEKGGVIKTRKYFIRLERNFVAEMQSYYTLHGSW